MSPDYPAVQLEKSALIRKGAVFCEVLGDGDGPAYSRAAMLILASLVPER
jgi:hypothetical protein